MNNQKNLQNVVIIILAVVVAGVVGYLIFNKNLTTPISNQVSEGNEQIVIEAPRITKIESSAYCVSCVQIYGEHFVANDSNDVIWINEATQTRFWGGRWSASSDGSRILDDKYVASQLEPPAKSESRKHDIPIPLIPKGDYDVIVVNLQGQSEPYEVPVSWEGVYGGGWGFFPPLIETFSVEPGNKLTIQGIFGRETVSVRFKDKSTLILVAEVKMVPITVNPATNESPIDTENITFEIPPALERGIEYLVGLSNDLGTDSNIVVFRIN